MADAGPKPSSSVKLVLLGEAAVGKVGGLSVSLLRADPLPVLSGPQIRQR